MKSKLLAIFLLFIGNIALSQTDTTLTKDTSTYRIIKTDGGELIGQIQSQDAREILLLTKDDRQIYIPQHAIKEVIKLKNSDFNNIGTFIGEDKFATRYFITTNGLPIKKGEHYAQWNLFGPDFQFGIGKDLGVGIMSSWIGVPIIGSIKKSWQIGDKSQFAIGGLVGTGSWIVPEFGGALPFATLSFGDRSKNIAFSGGYGAIWTGDGVSGRAISSIAGMAKISPKISLVFDSFVLLPNENQTGGALFIPGIRWHQEEGKAIQFGFAGIIADGDIVPVTIPTIQWYRSL
ncbi:MAG: hypothetical protein ACKVLH_01880 [Bacteroidia bacterium]|jgi:sRNA-binding regulator protein Hfq|tara:strand:+ start:198 stop:1067 length:870 start_codon:yes stop_codon:yes gene_type:complete